MNRKQQVHHELSLILWAMCLASLTLVEPAHAEDVDGREDTERTFASTIPANDWSAPVADTDDLDTYEEDLSAFGKSVRFAPEATTAVKHPARRKGARRTQVALSGAELRAVLDLRALGVADGLGTYDEDLSEFGARSAVRLEVTSLEPGGERVAREHPPQDRRVGASDDVTTYAGEDMLGTYIEDLSAFGRSARISAAVGTRTVRATTEHEARGADVDLVALRAWMRSPDFASTDDLGTYMEDWTGPTVMKGTAEAPRARAARSAVEAVLGSWDDRQTLEISIAGPSWSQQERGTRP